MHYLYEQEMIFELEKNDLSGFNGKGIQKVQN